MPIYLMEDLQNSVTPTLQVGLKISLQKSA